jgi:uncharacterized Rmd1/YagE family protein
MNHGFNQVLKIRAVCTAAEYNFDTLLPYLRQNFILSPHYFEEMLHVKLMDQDEKTPLLGQVFFFKNGSTVFWNVHDSDIDKIMAEVKNHEVSSYNTVETEDLEYRYVHQR